MTGVPCGQFTFSCVVCRSGYPRQRRGGTRMRTRSPMLRRGCSLRHPVYEVLMFLADRDLPSGAHSPDVTGRHPLAGPGVCSQVLRTYHADLINGRVEAWLDASAAGTPAWSLRSEAAPQVHVQQTLWSIERDAVPNDLCRSRCHTCHPG